MKRTIGGLVPIVALGLIMVILAGESTGAERASAPPLDGWMQNFVPADRPTPVGDIALAPENGATVSLRDVAGKLIVLNFWATWCAPCVREMPSLDRLAAAMKAEGLTVVALSEDFRGWPQMRPFLDKLGLNNLEVFHDPGTKAMQALKIKGLPTTLVIDAEGRELGRLTGTAEWDSPEAQALLRHFLPSGP